MILQQLEKSPLNQWILHLYSFEVTDSGLKLAANFMQQSRWLFV
ncbi:MAG: hypothetical protein OFPII_35070 [Osedax symbiont Rs1]|nr:MAG: hypothetical protein OFPII_35070 [Osedax symbiont Rs1]